MEKAYNISRRKKTRKDGDLLPFLLTVPALLVIAFVLVVPIFYGFFVSFFDCGFSDLNISENFVGFGNYVRMFKDETFVSSLKNTLIFVLFALSFDLIIGTLVAIVCNRLTNRISGIFRGIMTMALLISPTVVGVIFRFFFDSRSGWFYWLSGLTIKQFPGVAGKITAMILVIFAHCWNTVPFVAIVLSAGLLTIPTEYYEASAIDGAGSITQFFKITLPHLLSMYMVILITSGVDTLKIYDIVYTLTNGGPMNATISLSMYAYKRAYNFYELGYAMAISIFTMILCILIFGVPFSKYNKSKHEEGIM